MKRRLALTFAGSAAIVLTAGSAAVAANLGILGAASKEPVGQLDANTVADLSAPVTSLDPIVVTVDEIVEVPVEDPAPVAPAVESDDDKGPAVSGSGSGSSSDSGSPRTTVAPTTPTTRVDNSGPGSIDDGHSGSDDGHSGSGSSGSGDGHDDD
jgi:hypothetical protein